MPSKNSRLVYSTDPDAAVEPRRPASRSPARGAAPPALPEDGVIRVFVERKGRGGKSVSVLRGVPGHSQAKAELCKTLKARLGTGGAVKAGEIEIQGDHRDRILALLDEWGYRAKKAGG